MNFSKLHACYMLCSFYIASFVRQSGTAKGLSPHTLAVRCEYNAINVPRSFHSPAVDPV
jgi:hypothetical protein